METQRRALGIAETKGGLYHGYVLSLLENIAKTYAAQGDVANALATQTLLAERAEKALALYLSISSERQKLIQLDSLKEDTSRMISLNVESASDNPQASALSALLILQRKGRVLDAMADNLAVLRGRFNTEDRKLLDDLNAVTERLAKLGFKKPVQVSPEDYQKQIQDLEEEKENLEREISRRSDEFRAQSQTVTLDAVKAEIPNDAALIEFAVYRPYNPKAQNTDEAYGEPRYIAYILRRGADVKWKDLGDKKTIDETIDEMRKVLRDPEK